MRLLRQWKGLIRTKQALEHGIHPRTLYGIRDEGMLEEVSRGFYRQATLPEMTWPDLVTVALRVPQGVICLISALAYHELTAEIPHEVYIALPRGAGRPRIDYPPMRVFWLSGPAFEQGIDAPIVDGIPVRMYSPAKTVVDCFRFRNKIGLDVAVEGLTACLRGGRARPSEILHFARLCRVQNVMLPYLQALS